MDDHIPSHLLEFIEDYYPDESFEKQLQNAMFEREMISKHPPLNRAARRRIKAQNRKQNKRRK